MNTRIDANCAICQAPDALIYVLFRGFGGGHARCEGCFVSILTRHQVFAALIADAILDAKDDTLVAHCKSGCWRFVAGISSRKFYRKLPKTHRAMSIRG
ncbi:MAG: hypothetical protein CME88_01950 [Hirschia sp.]|nr:hypothetical protein [Hirschia sp.]MBF17125.1 hypothetical protein [Hirschia sp.]|tara:strand:- start:236 stop:532 length:297 start_codon:yes stop_codon:yes gene_type:complete